MKYPPQRRRTPSSVTTAGHPRPRHLRADAVLPAKLLRRIQKHAEAVYLWVPSRQTAARRKRDAKIVAQRADGVRVRDIATRFDLTERRVYHVLRREAATERDACSDEATR